MLTILANKFDEYVKRNFTQVVVEAIVNGNIQPFNDLCVSKDSRIKKINDEILEWRIKKPQDIYDYQNQEINKAFKQITERTIERDELTNKFMQERDIFKLLSYNTDIDTIAHTIISNLADDNARECSGIVNNYKDVTRIKEYSVVNYDLYRRNKIESLNKEIKSIESEVSSATASIKKLEEEKKNILFMIKNTTVYRAEIFHLDDHNEINDFDRVKFILFTSEQGEKTISTKIENCLMDYMDTYSGDMIDNTVHEKIVYFSKTVDVHSQNEQQINLSDSLIVKFTRVY